MTAVQVEDLHVSRGGREVLHGLSFAVEPGQVVGLLGPSGCGKTTLMRVLVGVQKNVRGTARVLGLSAGAPALRRRIGYVTQAPAVYGDLTVDENVRYFAALHGSPAGDVVEHVGLQAQRRQLVSTLSGGQRARVSLATALLGTPDLLVLDEPTVGLDPVLRRDLWELFRSLAESGTTLLVSSHVMDEASRCDRLLLLRDGHLVADDTLPGLLKRTRTKDVEAAFLALAEAS